MEHYTRELDKIASLIESHPNLTTEERFKLAHELDSISDNLEKIAKMDREGKWLEGDDDEDRYMKRYDETGAYESDEDEKRYMKDYKNWHEEQEVLKEVKHKTDSDYETRDLNTTPAKTQSITKVTPKNASERAQNLALLKNLKK